MKHILAASLALAAAGAGAVPLVGITSSNEIARFDSADATTATRVAISGLAAGDRFVGIDLRPGDKRIYGITLSNKLYTLDERTGAASFVAALSAPVIDPALAYGIDFNPVADFNGATSLRLVSSAGGNFAINANTGAVAFSGSIPGAFSAVSYSNSNALPSAAPASTALYYIDSSNDTLSVATGAFNAPTITTVGALGIDVLRANGFEVLGNGMAFAALNVDAGTSLATSVYSIDLATGAATALGTFNGTLSGLTVSAVPEPQSYAMFGLGLLGLGAVFRRRRAA